MPYLSGDLLDGLRASFITCSVLAKETGIHNIYSTVALYFFISSDEFGYQSSDPPVQCTINMFSGDEKVRGVLQIDSLVHLKPIESNEE